MDKTEMNKIVKETDCNTIYCYHESHGRFVPQELLGSTDEIKLVFRPFDFATTAAVSENSL